jgi:hypothetical protein
MNFDDLCNIILEGKNAQQKIKVTVSNPTPVFTIQDILRDQNDYSRGVRTYLDEDIKGADMGEPVDDERIARRSLRRVNWVSRMLLKRLGTREIDIRKLHINIISFLEKYLQRVMRYDEDQLDKLELATAKEAAFIGNMLLPPNDRYPNAKGAFVVVDDNIDELKKKGTSVSEYISRAFNMTVDQYIDAFDPDLIGTIKEIIREGKPERIEMQEPEEIATESFESGGVTSGVTVSDILKDERIRGVYDIKVVKSAIKSMITLGTIKQNVSGGLEIVAPGDESWRSSMNKKDIEVEDELVSSDEDDIRREVGIDKGHEIEDEENSEIDDESEIAAIRLGYKKQSNTEQPEEDEEDEEDAVWYK